MLSWAEIEKSFIITGPVLYDYATALYNFYAPAL